MDWKYLFLRFDGRISRQPYWIGLVCLVLVQFALLWIAARAFDVSYEFLLETSPAENTINLIITLLLAYPSLAITIKRLHDRNRTGWWAGLMYGLTILLDLVDLAGFGGTRDEPGVAVLVIVVPTLVVALWLFVELGFLKGTQGPNRFGPDPLGATQADASL